MTDAPVLAPEASAPLPTRYGAFVLHVFRDTGGREILALAAGAPGDGVLLRLHSECATGDILGSLRCDCRDQMEEALGRIAADGHGLFLYLRGHEGRGIGLAAKIRAYALQDTGLDTVEANRAQGLPDDARDYGAACAVLRHFGVHRVRLLSNNPAKIAALEAEGIQVEARVPLWTAPTPDNARYLDTKRRRMGHLG